MFVLVAGDSDYLTTVEELKKDGFVVEVVFWNHAVKELRRAASKFTGLDQYLDALRL